MASGLKTKIGYLELLAQVENTQIICVSETWLKDGMEDAEIKIKGYNIIRTDRLDRGGGGLAFYVHQNITPIVHLSFSNSICEALVIRIPEHKTVYFAVYRPPNFKDSDVLAFQEVLERVNTSLNELAHLTPGCSGNIIGFGDFNLPKLNWFSEGFPMIPGNSGNSHDIYKAFIDFAQNNFLTQTITTPTRGNNILDLVLTNNESLLGPYKTLVNKDLTDHNTLVLQLECSWSEKEQILNKASVYLTAILNHRIFLGD